jgi:cell division septal protein FtsQ
MATKSSSRSSSRKSNSKRQFQRTAVLRYAVWAIAIIALLGGVVGSGYGMNRLFFTGNGHFLVRDIQVIVGKGALNEDEIAERLGVSLDETNLYDVDLEQRRADLLEDPLIQEVEIRRILPSTLQVTAYGRTPVAQLQKNGGRLIDGHGIILPPSPRRETLSLPVITGIGGVSDFATGETISDNMVLDALRFLELRDLQQHGYWLDVNYIQLDPSYKQLRLMLRAKESLLIRDGAMIVLPVDDMAAALGRVIRVVESRSRSHQPTSEINAVFEKPAALP